MKKESERTTQKTNDDVVIVSAARTPFSRFGGVLKKKHSMDLAAMIMEGVLDKIKLKKNIVDTIYYGMCIQSEAAIEYNVNGRQAMLKAGFPPETISLTIDRACCSSLTATHLGYKDVLLGEANVVMAVGTDNMSNTPFVMHGVRWAKGLEQPQIRDHLFPVTYNGYNALAFDAGQVALKHDINREEQDKWAYNSQMRYQAAKAKNVFKDEILPIQVDQPRGEVITFEEDEFPRANSKLEKLSTLKTVYGSPTVTAGNAPGLDAGASAIVIMKRKKANELGLETLGKIVSIASVASEPRLMAEVPAPAIEKVLKKADLTIEDMDRIEINEAFAAMPLVTTKILGKGNTEKTEHLRKITNVNGGAVAIGHPVGASGARILMTLLYELRRSNKKYGVASICGGLAQGDAIVVEAE